MRFLVWVYLMDFEIENDCVNRKYTYNSVTEVPTLDSSTLTYNTFFNDFMVKNIPCIIKNVTKEWQASLYWTKGDQPNFDYLLNQYGHSKVTIYNCNERYFNSQKTRASTLAEYIEYWEHYTNDMSPSLVYLKDWHLKLLNEKDNFYQVPIYFASDWLNEFYTGCLKDDYRFVYMGMKNTWTPFHVDVFTSYSWSANVCGTKMWWLFPPGEENHLRDNLKNLPFDVSSMKDSVKYFEVIQNKGEVLFVPSGWYHQVINLEDTISVNHNWINSCNISNMWLSMKNNLEAVYKEIEDCKDMEDFEEHCQIMLNAAFGMDYYKFYDFIKYIALSRIEMIKGNKPKILFHGHKIGMNHILYDLKSIKCVLEAVIHCVELTSLPYFTTVDLKPYTLLEKIVGILEDNI